MNLLTSDWPDGVGGEFHTSLESLLVLCFCHLMEFNFLDHLRFKRWLIPIKYCWSDTRMRTQHLTWIMNVFNSAVKQLYWRWCHYSAQFIQFNVQYCKIHKLWKIKLISKHNSVIIRIDSVQCWLKFNNLINSALMWQNWIIMKNSTAVKQLY